MGRRPGIEDVQMFQDIEDIQIFQDIQDNHNEKILMSLSV